MEETINNPPQCPTDGSSTTLRNPNVAWAFFAGKWGVAEFKKCILAETFWPRWCRVSCRWRTVLVPMSFDTHIFFRVAIHCEPNYFWCSWDASLVNNQSHFFHKETSAFNGWLFANSQCSKFIGTPRIKLEHLADAVRLRCKRHKRHK